MPINQLFKNMPDRSFVITLINLYGIVDFDDNKYFTKNTLETLNTVENLNNMSDKLKEYYIDCKSNTYLKDITLKRSIVILRHFLKCHNFNIHSKEKFIKGTKQTTYRIIPQMDGIVIPNKPKPVVVSFD